MVRFKLKRRISGAKIRKAEREKEYKRSPPEIHQARLEYHAKPITKRRDNPTIYKGEETLKCGYRDIRVPSKKRIGAIKRFKRAFPQYKIDKRSNKIKFIEDFNYWKYNNPQKIGLNPMPKKKIN